MNDQNQATRISLKKINLSLFALSALLFVVYLIEINTLSVKGFAIADFKGQLNELNRENANLEVKINTLRSYSYLETKIAKLNLVPTDNIIYLDNIDQTIAKR